MVETRTIGCVIVCYNTPNIITDAVKSIVNFVDKLIIVDNSKKQHQAYKECDDLEDQFINLKVIHTEKNIGHGPALNIGVDELDTFYIVCMDSDAKLIDPSLLDDMRISLDNNDQAFGAGKIVTMTSDKRHGRKQVPYLFLPFCMFKLDEYNMYSNFIHDGAPFRSVMNDIYKKKTLISIPNFEDKLYHKGKQTRKIAGNWRSGFGGPDGI